MANGLNGIKDWASRMTPMQKILIGAALITVVVGGFVLRGSTPTVAMTPLFTDLAPADAQSVIDELDSRGVAHELTDSGKTVMVPQADVYDLRVALSAAGLPASNDGYALMDQQGITTSEFMQRVDYQRALEGELSNTLRAMDGVQTATVRLAMPDDSLFVDQPAQTTASVMIDTGGMDTLGGDAVQAIVHLVAASVKDLDPKNVTVVDAKGAVLSGPSADGISGSAGGVTARTKAEQSYEQTLAASLTAMLAKVAGGDHVTVSVQASLNLDQKSATSEKWGQTDPNGTTKLPGIVASESTNEENYTGSGAGANTGVLGPDGAVISAQPGSSSDTYDKTSADRNFHVDRVVQQEVTAPGAVTGLHVAVLFDDKVVTAEQATAMTETVRAAAGLDDTRGDTLVVTRAPFAEVAVDDSAATEAAATAAAASKTQLFSMVRTGALLLVVLIALLLGWSSARRARRVVATPMQLPELEAGASAMYAQQAGEMTMTPMHDPELEPWHETHEPHEIQAVPATMALPVAEPPVHEYQEVVDLAAQNPIEVANVIRSWLSADLEASRS